jgi:hypothetical protein
MSEYHENRQQNTQHNCIFSNLHLSEKNLLPIFYCVNVLAIEPYFWVRHLQSGPAVGRSLNI